MDVAVITALTMNHIYLVTAVMPNIGFRRLCPVGKYMASLEEEEGKCRRCTTCRKGYEVTVACTDISNTVCTKCPGGTYNSDRAGVCKTCTSCKLGEFVRLRCKSHRDVKCQPCYPKTYTDRENAGACRYCRYCRTHEVVKMKCSPTNDTVCGDCKKGYFREFGSSTCLPCSVCPLQLSNRVVSKCRDELGHDNANICWPSQDASDRFRLPSNVPMSTLSTVAMSTEVDEQQSQTAERGWWFISTFIVSAAALWAIASGIVICGICLYRKKKNSLTSEETNTSSIRKDSSASSSSSASNSSASESPTCAEEHSLLKQPRPRPVNEITSTSARTTLNGEHYELYVPYDTDGEDNQLARPEYAMTHGDSTNAERNTTLDHWYYDILPK